MRDKEFKAATEHVPDHPPPPRPPPKGNDALLLERLRYAGISLADSVTTHEKHCASKTGGLCTCDVVIFVSYYNGRRRKRSGVRLRD